MLLLDRMQKAWDITRCTEVLVKPIRKQVKPTQYA